MKALKQLGILGLIVMGFALVSCEKDGEDYMEDTKDGIQEAAEETGDMIEEAAEETEDEIDDAL